MMSLAPVTLLEQLELDIHFDELRAQFGKTRQSEAFLRQAMEIFRQALPLCHARGLYRIFDISQLQEETLVLQTGEQDLELRLGSSARLLKQAETVVIGAYTCGEDLQNEVQKASMRQRYLDAYVTEQLGLLCLTKTGQAMNRMIEDMATQQKTGIGPLLSPGSVHGWNLSEQSRLCSVLPLDEIGVSCTDFNVLMPFHSLSFIIGLGPGYSSSTVAIPCITCANRAKCTMRECHAAK